MTVVLSSLPDVLKRYETALAWLRANDVRTNGTRLAAYRTTMERAVAEEARERREQSRVPELRNAVIEASEIIEIAQIDAVHLAEADVQQKLRHISSGPVVMAPGHRDPARDYALEFHTAAVLQRHGEFGGFSREDGDLMVTAEGYPAECKRVSSLESLRSRLRDGKAKLTQLAQGGNPPGVIVLDLTRPVTMAHGPIIGDTDDTFLQEAERRLTAYLKVHLMTWRNVEMLATPPVLGVVSRCLSGGSVGDDANVRRSVVWQACSLHADGSGEDALFRRVARAFGAGELREGTRAEIDDAVARIDVIPNRRP
jgi:hypothetical protein